MKICELKKIEFLLILLILKLMRISYLMIILLHNMLNIHLLYYNVLKMLIKLNKWCNLLFFHEYHHLKLIFNI